MKASLGTVCMSSWARGAAADKDKPKTTASNTVTNRFIESPYASGFSITS
jgi:hypothetical protein